MPPAIEIDRAGDLTLILNKNLDCAPEENARTLLVSSKVLTLASPVFAAMLGPRFREGQRSDSGALDPVSLPDDDAEAVTVLCQIFHFRYDVLPEKPSLELFKNLAVLSDKYDCVAPLRFASETWLVMWETTTKREDLEVLLFVSFLFGRAERFAALSGRIVREFNGNLKHLPILGAFDALPEGLHRGLQQQRKAVLKSIEAAIAHHVDIMEGVTEKVFLLPFVPRWCLSCSKPVQQSTQLCPKCRTYSAPGLCSRLSRRGEYVRILREAGLDPLRLWSVMGSKSIEEIAASIVKAQEASYNHNCESSGQCPLRNAFALLKKDVNTVAISTKGLCLDCINSEHENVGLKPDCRVGHGKDGLIKALETVVIEE